MSRRIKKAANKFGNRMADLREFGHEIERIPEKFCNATLVDGRKALTKEGADIGVGVLKEMSGIVAYGVREATGVKKTKGPFKSNLAKGWFE